MIAHRIPDVARLVEAIYPSFEHQVVGPLVYTNVGDIGDPEFTNWVYSSNAPRAVMQESVSLFQYEPGTIVDRDGSYLTLSNASFVVEQVPPWVTPSRELAISIIRRTQKLSATDREFLLVARYGETTWGHWLCEMLTKIVVAEDKYPERFTYVLPAKVLSAGPDATPEYVSAVLGSLAAYGIDSSRIFPLPVDCAVSFDNLYDISSIFSDGIHPHVLLLMMAAVKKPRLRPLPKKVALLRRSTDFRSITNLIDVSDLLAHRQYHLMDIASMPFEAQATLFANVDSVVAGLGSGVAGSIYMRHNAEVVTLGPGSWYDGYFVNILARKSAFHADVRGFSLRSFQNEIARSPFQVDLKRLNDALDCLAPASRSHLPNGTVDLEGVLQPRRLGNKLFEIRFGWDGNSSRYKGIGWCETERHHTWSCGRNSSLIIPTAVLLDADCWLEILGSSLVKEPELVSRPLRIRINGHDYPQKMVSKHCHLFWYVRKEHLRREFVKIEFDHPICPSPQSLGISDDKRPLAFLFLKLAWYEISRT